MYRESQNRNVNTSIIFLPPQKAINFLKNEGQGDEKVLSKLLRLVHEFHLTFSETKVSM